MATYLQGTLWWEDTLWSGGTFSERYSIYPISTTCDEGTTLMLAGFGNIIVLLGGLRVTKPTIRLACPSVCPSVRQHFACKHDNSTNINRIGPKLIPWMYLKSVLVKFEYGWPWPIFEVTGVNLNMKICNFRL